MSLVLSERGSRYGFEIRMFGVVYEFAFGLRLLSMMWLIYHFNSLLRTLYRPGAYIVILESLLGLLLLALLLQRLCQSHGLFEIVDGRVVNRSIIRSFQLGLTVVLDRLVINARVLPSLLSI